MNWYKQIIKEAFPKKIEFSEEDIEVIKELIEKGNSLRQVSEAAGVSKGVIERLDRKYQWSQPAKKRIDDEYAQKIKDLVDKGYNFQRIIDSLPISFYHINKIIKDYNIPTNFFKPEPLSEEEKNEMERLYTEEGLGLLEIAKRMGRSDRTVSYYLTKKGIYKSDRAAVKFFKPSEEDIKKIDYWYTLPPKGEGRSLNWISGKFGVSVGSLLRWFRKTGREIRSATEQKQTPATKDDMSLAQMLVWEERGGFKGYLQSLPKEQAIRFLNRFVIVIFEENKGKAMFIRDKYMKIINESNPPEETQQPSDEVKQQEISLPT